ncbi:MAG: NAD-dependent DNA ligase LigA, partial [Bacteroidota bacterium]
MPTMDPQKRIQKLSESLREHNHNYYVLAEPTISDFEFDQLLKELGELEAQYPQFREPDSPTQRVGGDITKNFPSFRHIRPMLSLGNSYSQEDIIDFDEQIQKLTGGNPYTYILEHKFDGVSLSLHYENGLLVRGVTRGDGVSGEEITANAKTIQTVPLRLRGENIPAQLEVRGEVVMMREDFDRLNVEREKEGLEPLRNPRNTTAGTLKQQDSSAVAKRPMVFFAFFLASDDLQTQTDAENMALLTQWGFRLSGHNQVAENIEAVRAYLDDWEEKKAQL